MYPVISAIVDLLPANIKIQYREIDFFWPTRVNFCILRRAGGTLVGKTNFLEFDRNTVSELVRCFTWRVKTSRVAEPQKLRQTRNSCYVSDSLCVWKRFATNASTCRFLLPVAMNSPDFGHFAIHALIPRAKFHQKKRLKNATNDQENTLGLPSQISSFCFGFDWNVSFFCGKSCFW